MEVGVSEPVLLDRNQTPEGLLLLGWGGSVPLGAQQEVGAASFGSGVHWPVDSHQHHTWLFPACLLRKCWFDRKQKSMSVNEPFLTPAPKRGPRRKLGLETPGWSLPLDTQGRPSRGVAVGLAQERCGPLGFLNRSECRHAHEQVSLAGQRACDFDCSNLIPMSWLYKISLGLPLWSSH